MSDNKKMHIGLITLDKTREELYKQAMAQFGGGYVHTAADHLMMNSKLGIQRVDLFVYECGVDSDAMAVEASSRVLSVINFIRSKSDCKKLPVLIFYPGSNYEFKNLISDPRVRAFSKNIDPFMALFTIKPFIDNPDAKEAEALPEHWVESEFMQSIEHKVGSSAVFAPAKASDEDLHAGFLCQVNLEVRSHLAWVKIGARILERQQDGFAKIFKGISHDIAEEFAENLLTQITGDFQQKLTQELSSRGALFFSSIEEFSPADRKTIYGASKASAYLFQSEQIAILLEIIRYL